MKKLGSKRIISLVLAAALCAGLFAWLGRNNKAQAATASDVVNIAIAEIGYFEKASEKDLDSKTANKGSHNWTKYARDVGYAQAAAKTDMGRAWCGFFVWWCCMKAGLPKTAYAATGSPEYAKIWYKNNGQWKDKGSYVPKAGDIIIYDYQQDGTADHIGIVEYVQDGVVHTIEGNISDQVNRSKRALNHKDIVGYGIVNYDGKTTTITDPEENPGKPYAVPVGTFKKGKKGDDIKWIQTSLNNIMNAGLDVDGDFGSLTEAAVKNFQKKYKIEVDGVVGNQTITTMISAWKTIQAEKKASTPTPEVKKDPEYAVIVNLMNINSKDVTISGITSGKTYSGTVSFTVSCADVCTVMVKKDYAKAYSRLQGSLGVNGCEYKVNVDVDTEIVIARSGDVDGNGVVDADDAMSILKYDVRKLTLTEKEMFVADVDRDGKVDSNDAMTILKYDVKKASLEW